MILRIDKELPAFHHQKIKALLVKCDYLEGVRELKHSTYHDVWYRDQFELGRILLTSNATRLWGRELSDPRLDHLAFAWLDREGYAAPEDFDTWLDYRKFITKPNNKQRFFFVTFSIARRTVSDRIEPNIERRLV